MILELNETTEDSSFSLSIYLQKDGPGAPGGQSWTAQWLKFDNSYFKVRIFYLLLWAVNIGGSLEKERGVTDFTCSFCNCCYMQDIKEKRDEDLLVLPTDAALFEDPSFKVNQLKFYFRVHFNSSELNYVIYPKNYL